MSAQQPSLQDGSDRTVSPVRLLRQQNPDPLAHPRHPHRPGSRGLPQMASAPRHRGETAAPRLVLFRRKLDHTGGGFHLTYSRHRVDVCATLASHTRQTATIATVQPAPFDEHARKEYRNEL
jgi:hypothetical protein